MKDITVIVPLGKKSEFAALHSLNKNKKDINVIIERGPNPSINRNKGAKKAKTKFIAFINGHTILSDSWIKEVRTFFKKYPEIDVVGGPHLSHKDENAFAKASGYAFTSMFGAAGVASRYRQDKLNLNADDNQLTSANLICRSKVLKKVQFDKNIYPGEDPKFVADSRKAGFKVAYAPRITVFNKRRHSLSSLAKQIFNYGITHPQKETFLETLKKPYFLPPSVFVLYLMLLTFLTLLSPLFLLPLALYFVLIPFFSIYHGLKNKDIAAIFILPLIFATIHITYGLGFIIGTFKK